MLVGNLSITLGANFDILKDANFTREDKYCQRGDKKYLHLVNIIKNR